MHKEIAFINAQSRRRPGRRHLLQTHKAGGGLKGAACYKPRKVPPATNPQSRRRPERRHLLSATRKIYLRNRSITYIFVTDQLPIQ